MSTVNLGRVALADRGAWSSAADYTPLDFVTHRGGAFLCRAACRDLEPGVDEGWSAKWAVLANGVLAVADAVSSGTVTQTFTLSDGTTLTASFSATEPAPGSVTEETLADGAVAEDKLADEAVTEDKLADEAVTGAKLSSPFVLPSHLYGPDLPAAGTPGRIFFRTVSS